MNDDLAEELLLSGHPNYILVCEHIPYLNNDKFVSNVYINILDDKSYEITFVKDDEDLEEYGCSWKEI